MFCEMFLSLAFIWSAYQSGVAPQQWYLGSNLLNKLSAFFFIYFSFFLFLKVFLFTQKMLGITYFQQFQSVMLCMTFLNQYLVNLTVIGSSLKNFHYVDNFNVIWAI